MQSAPELRSEPDIALERLRSCCEIMQPLWSDTMKKSACLALCIGVTGFWQNHLNGAPVQDIQCHPFMKYESMQFIASAQEKLHQLRVSNGEMAKMLAEISKSLLFLEKINSNSSTSAISRISSCFVGTHAILQDSYTHIEAYLNRHASED